MPEVQDAADAIDLAAPASVRRITFENVGFHYNGPSDDTVLQGINLTAEPGQMIAILGATGSGKSTLVNLIPRFYDAARGGYSSMGWTFASFRQDSLLAHIGIVPQETVLFLRHDSG